MNILRIDENHLMRNSNKEIILHQMLENSEFPAKETSKIIKNKTSKFAGFKPFLKILFINKRRIFFS